jgi:hypothetical protein
MPWNSKSADATINLDNMMTGQALVIDAGVVVTG